MFSIYFGDLVECNISDTIDKKWFETISEELKSNVNVLKEIIEVRDEVKACESLGMDDVQSIIDICIDMCNKFPDFFGLFNLCVTI